MGRGWGVRADQKEIKKKNINTQIIIYCRIKTQLLQFHNVQEVLEKIEIE